MTAALLRVREELGQDATIIGTRTYEPTGIRRLWERPYVEVFAGRTRSAEEAQAARTAVQPTPARPGLQPAAEGDMEAWIAGRLSRLEPRTLALVGPTGGGKTTTIAKLAARYALDRGERVGLITTDTYRIGAVHHLQTYAEIMGLPWRVAQDPPAMREAVAALAYCDRVLIDTSGRNFRRDDARRELLALLSAASPESVEFVLSLTTGREEMEELTSYFKNGPATRLLLTKLDEASSTQKLVAALQVVDLPLFAITNGQMVPDDIWFPTAQQLAQAVAREAAVGHA